MLKMMLRVLSRNLVVVALLVSVTSAQGCSVCGDGYQVGSPSAITTFRRFPEQSDTQFTCSDLEFAGLEGLLPNEECSVLPILIFETCNCKEDAASTSLHGPGYSSLRRVQQSSYAASPALVGTSSPVVAPIYLIGPASSPSVGAPLHYPTAPWHSAPFHHFSPVATTSFDPISYAYLPSSYTPPIAAPTEAPGTQSIIIFVLVVATGSFFTAVACRVAMRNSPQTRTTTQSLPAPGNGRQILATPSNLPVIPVSAPTLLKVQALARRPLVLAVLFPDERKVSNAMRRASAFFPTCLSTSDF